MNTCLPLNQLKRHALLLSALLLWGIYLGWIASRPQNVFWTVDEGGKFIYMKQFLRNGNPSAPLDYPGRPLDPEGKFYPSSYVVHRDGQVYMWWQIGFPILASFFYRLLGWSGLYFLPATAGVLTAWLSAEIISLITAREKWALFAFWAVGLCTPIAFYSTMFWEHTLTTCGVTASLYLLLLGMQQQRQRWFYIAGISAALAVFFRLEAITLLAGFGLILLFRSWKQAIRYGLSFIAALTPLIFWHWRMTGFPFAPIVDQLVQKQSFSALQTLNKRFLAHIFFNPPAVWTLELPRPWLIFASLAVLLIVPGLFIRRLRWLSILASALTLLPVLWILTSPIGYRSLQGLITAGPIVLAAIWLYARSPKTNQIQGNLPPSLFRAMLTAGLILLGILYTYKAWVGAGGLQWGPRYLLSVYPLLTIAAWIGLAQHWTSFSLLARRSLAILYITCALLGFAVQVRGALSVRTVMNYYQQSEPVYQSLPNLPIITAWCDIVYLLPSLYDQKPFFSVTYPTLDQWNEHAQTIGIETFYVANLDMCSPDMLDQIALKRLTDPDGLEIIQFHTERYPNHE